MALRGSIFLRRAERDDLDQVVSWMDDEDFIQFLYGDPTRSPQRLREQIVTMLGRTANNTLPGGIYLIIDSLKHGPVGMLAITGISWRNRSCNIDTYLGNKKLRNNIVAAMAFYRALEYCFNELNMHRVNLFVYSFNPRSWRIIERTGAKRELVLKDHVARDGKLYDMFGYGLLEDEFRELFEEVKTKYPDLTLQGNLETYVESITASMDVES